MRLVAKKRCSKLRGAKKLGLRVSCGLLRATIWIADAHRDNGKRFAARSEENLSALSNLNRRVKVSFHKIKTTHRDGQIAARIASSTGAQGEQ